MTQEKVDLSRFAWFNPPEQPELSEDGLEFLTAPNTDFWQRTRNGLRRNNGHAFLTRLWDDFSFSVQTEYFYESIFDQSGIFLYLDEENWAKLSVEYEDEAFGLLGSTVTNAGYSDWATTPLPTDYNRTSFRIGRRGRDFRFDCAAAGESFRQIRIFHMHGDLSIAKVGVYACSPGNSSFRVRFTDFRVGPAAWND